MQVKHQFVSSIPDDPNAAAAGEVLPSHWNADHQVTLTGADVTGALGYTPYNATNPANYVDQAGARASISATAPLAYNATTGEMSFTGSFVSTNPNKIQNGDFQVDQRNNGAIVNGITTNRFTIDRWFDQTTNAVFAVQRAVDASPNRFYHYRRVIQTAYNPTTDSANYCVLTQSIEAAELADLLWGTASAKAVTIQFEVNTTIAGTYPFAIQNLAATRRSYVTSYVVPAANVWTPITITIPGDTASALGTALTSEGLNIRFSHGAGGTYSVVPALMNQWINADVFNVPTLVQLCNTVGAEFRLRKVKLEVGSTATAFQLDNVSLSAEMVRRYYQRGTLSNRILSNNANSNISITVPFRTPMRAAPTVQVTMSNGALTSVSSVTTDSFIINGTASATGLFDLSWTATSEI
jgi:hypothetical protein